MYFILNVGDNWFK